MFWIPSAQAVSEHQALSAQSSVPHQRDIGNVEPVLIRVPEAPEERVNLQRMDEERASRRVSYFQHLVYRKVYRFIFLIATNMMMAVIMKMFLLISWSP